MYEARAERPPEEGYIVTDTVTGNLAHEKREDGVYYAARNLPQAQAEKLASDLNTQIWGRR